MSGFLTRQLSEITALLEASGRRLATSVVLLVVAFVFVLASLGFLSVALYLWVAELTQPVIAALAVAGLHIAVAGVCFLVFWLRARARSKKSVASNSIPEDAVAGRAQFAESIDQTMAPLIAVLHEANMKPEEAALRLGVALTKQVGPLGLVALALGAGFILARRVTAPNKE
ncbi:MAG: phage holin family protein [Xanthobacteraceae bacterium]